MGAKIVGFEVRTAKASSGASGNAYFFPQAIFQ
jgi:hypothetical protein